ncbi:T9SS type A sorting domain-containing protein [Ginsengibacter hankyongi]|uniref:T9SS type A sorting domain-containing protein n=1 Tax=Ginsengibacter hankyongi TaxID=2607284 RepID=A0A5J5INH3_9BACT|nr:T9SS type A sorting domain-containing protein [Ginsengibacter hankyongi]KAA9042088.1 T9SS type A sorting domain-containing protein [Ginsengibacter hankyongi]
MPNRRFVSVIPNPFRQKLLVTIEALIPGRVILIINDNSGRQLYKQSKNITAGTNEIEINEAAKLSRGMYILTVIESKQTQSIKVIKGN